jgi:anaerobic magnesium-protoporphyrin IX monomethyl ester cyclase
MKIVLINPPLKTMEMFGLEIERGASQPPLGLCYIAAVARSNGYEIEILDAEALGLSEKECAKKIIELNANVLGLTATTSAIKTASRIAETVKIQRPDCLTVLGGCHVTAIPEITLKRCPSIDVAVIGEGERTFIELLRAFKENKSFENIDGIAFRKDGLIRRTRERVRIHNLDELPMPAWDLLPELRTHYQVQFHSRIHTPSFSLVTSRGCLGTCRFCPKTTFGSHITHHSGKGTFEMVSYLRQKYGIRSILFDEDNLLFPHDRIIEFSNLMIDAELDVDWACLTRVDSVPEWLLKKIQYAGCWQLLFGIESGSQRILNFIGKNITLSKISRAVHSACDVGISPKGFFILGLPTETHETIQETINFMLELPLDDITFCYFTPFPGTEFANSAHLYGKMLGDWDKMNLYEPSFIPNDLTEDDLIQYGKLCTKLFYSRQRILDKYKERAKYDQDSNFSAIHYLEKIISAFG